MGPRRMSQGWDFLGRVFMWWAVAFFFGLEEHSIVTPTPPLTAGGSANFTALPPPPSTGAGATASLVPNRAETDISRLYLSQFYLQLQMQDSRDMASLQ